MSNEDLTNIILILTIVIAVILTFIILPKVIKDNKKDKEIEDSITNN